jgi:hypothetical protein
MSFRELTELFANSTVCNSEVQRSFCGLYSMSFRGLTELLRTLQYVIQKVNGAFADSTVCLSEG